MKHYHYIFTGSGLSALMTVYEMIKSRKFEDKSILLIDENLKKTNDRTWCFWEDTNLFDEIVSKKWNSALFANESFQKVLNIEPFQYKKIKGLDFYNLVFELIFKQNNIHFSNQKVIDFEELGNHCVVKTDSESYTCNKVFNSILDINRVKLQSKYPLLQQHFIGWFIKSKEAVFNPNCATFMDFSVEQKGNTRFMYVLPTSETEALIEYTLFSKDLLSTSEYESEIENYIQKLGISEFEIIEKEQGNIPMTCYEFWKHNTKNIINIGSAGGWTKPSTGFTFKNVTKKSKELVQFLQSENDFKKFHKKDKFWFYDLLFIDVLYQNNALGSKVFSSIFRNGNPITIFKFLDNESSFLEDLQIIWKCPKLPFLKAVFNRIIKF
ncbi:lycopene cyclase family protein [Flavobacterium capsici]|uniref:Lycopene cyclase family protein n=1 Tax=Flavobacterium capsici TaxID=3075618 RepID=A0AA96JA16_9FLAO|nr:MULTISPECIES: lycopene cyclase family protein [unclassified Flavobacterium]WNM19745.1 lycopene cyclase family protein [Flavobacterium sp. PMR2A8]WNM21134.1 lycopene cyclase family protein [Flavobacterium sp. PMTSA4]